MPSIYSFHLSQNDATDSFLPCCRDRNICTLQSCFGIFFCTMSAEEKTFILFVTRRIPLLRRVLQGWVGVCLELLFLSVWDPSKKKYKKPGKRRVGAFWKARCDTFSPSVCPPVFLFASAATEKGLSFFSSPRKKTRIFLALFFW